MSRHYHHHHHHDADVQIMGKRSVSNEQSSKTRFVLGQLKTKVKRNRLSKNDSSESVNGTSVTTTHHHRHRKSHQETHASFSKINSKSVESQSISYRKKPSLNSNHTDEYEEVFIEDDSVVPNGINQDDDNQISNEDKNIPTLKPKLIEATKSLPETNNSRNSEKRKQTLRRTGFQVRDEDFRSIFTDLPPDEQLITGFPCAWKKDVFMHGRMFLSLNYVSFYTCFFKWEEKLCIAYKDIVNVTREKSAKLVPNAIRIGTNKNERYFFACYIPREKAFISIFRLWQNTLLEQPLNYQQLRKLFYDDQQFHDESTGDSEESMVSENSVKDLNQSRVHFQSLPAEYTDSSKSTVRHNWSINSLEQNNDETVTYLSQCSCKNHLSKTYAEQLITHDVDHLFELICGDNSFTRDFHNSQKLTDYTYEMWHLNNETGQRERFVTYKAVAQGILGSNTLFCREKQILEVEKPHLMYVLNTEVYNEGIKYTDTFYVATKFCMIQHNTKQSLLKISAEIRYVKNVNGLVKTFIEKNAYSSIENGIREQVRQIENQQILQNDKKKSKKKVRNGKPKEKDLSSNEIDLLQSKNIDNQDNSFINKIHFKHIGLFIGICLLLLHIFLCYKLYSINEILSTIDTNCLH